MNTEMNTDNTVVLQQEEVCKDCDVWEDMGRQNICLCDKCFEKENPEDWEEHLQL